MHSSPLPLPLCEKTFMFSSIPFEHRGETFHPFREQYREWEEKNFRIVHLHRGNFFNSSWGGSEETNFVISSLRIKMILSLSERIFFFFFRSNIINILPLIDDLQQKFSNNSIASHFTVNMILVEKKETIYLTYMEI